MNNKLELHRFILRTPRVHCVVSLTLRNILLFAHTGTFASVCVCAVIMGFNIALSSDQTDNKRKFWVILDQVGGKQDVFYTFLVGVKVSEVVQGFLH